MRRWRPLMWYSLRTERPPGAKGERLRRGRLVAALAMAIAIAIAGLPSVGAASPSGTERGGIDAGVAKKKRKKCKRGRRKSRSGKRKKCRKRKQRPSAPTVAPAPVPPTPPDPLPAPQPGPVTPQDVHTVPASVPDDCSVPVEDQLMAWLATVPDGSTVRFGAGRCYGQDGTITLADRTGLVIDGQGSEFRALTPGGSHRANWRLLNGANLTVRNMAVRGFNPQGLYDHDLEWQHGFAIEGVQGMTLSDVQVREVWGDGVDVYRGGPSHACGDDASSARDVLITDALIERVGRQGVAVVDAERVALQDSTIGPVAWANVDIETDDGCEIAREITVARNSFGSNGWGVIVNQGFGADPQVGAVSVTDNVQTAPTVDTGILTPDPCRAPVRVRSPAGLYRDGYSFARNSFLTPNNAFVFRGVTNIDVGSNSVVFGTPIAGCDTRAGVRLTDSHTVGIIDNAFSGASNVYIADPLSTGITATGNTTD
jgi:hypothetical protein